MTETTDLLLEPAASNRYLGVVALLKTAEDLLAEGADGGPMQQAVVHLIRCAAQFAEVADCGDLTQATEGLSIARAAVGCATYAVRAAHSKAVQSREERGALYETNPELVTQRCVVEE